MESLRTVFVHVCCVRSPILLKNFKMRSWIKCHACSHLLSLQKD